MPFRPTLRRRVSDKREPCVPQRDYIRLKVSGHNILEQSLQCDCLDEPNATSVLTENILDMSNTLARIMMVCKITECQAKFAVDLISHNLLNFEKICYTDDPRSRKMLRKEDLMQGLGGRCRMSRQHAKLAYAIIKRGFKAFYYSPKHPPAITVGPPRKCLQYFNEECVYLDAAKKTAHICSWIDANLTDESNYADFEKRIKVLYKKFYDRMMKRREQLTLGHCKCCNCLKDQVKREYADSVIKKEAINALVGGPACKQEQKSESAAGDKCSICQHRKRKHEPLESALCSRCHMELLECICEEDHIAPPWVRSIWEQCDFGDYFWKTIEKHEMEMRQKPRCYMTPVESEDLMGNSDAAERNEGDTQSRKSDNVSNK